ncbi:MAG: hypothetical protein ACPH78_04915 [Flavobacteriales bacterium]
MTRFGLFMFHVCALAWTLVALPDRALAQCDVDVATSLVFSQGEPTEGYGLTLETVAEHTTGNLAGLTTYRLHMQTAHPTDRVIAAVGDNEFPLSLMPETAFYQNPSGNNTPNGISPAWISFFPDLAFDSWVTVGLDEAPSSSDGEEGVTMLFSSSWENAFGSGLGFVENSGSGSGWTVIPWSATNTLSGPEQRVLLAQLTTDGHLSGSMRVQVFPQGDNENDLRLDVTFNTDVVCGCMDLNAANFDAAANAEDGSCLYAGCTDPGACNFDVDASEDDGSCIPPNFEMYDCGCEGDLPDAAGVCGGDCEVDSDADGICDDVDECIGEIDICGVCNGPGAIYECGCPGVVPDAVGECGGTCTADEDEDGVCDDVDDCIGTYDACGVCNGPGEVYDCGCAPLPEGDCDCDGNVVDALGVCGGGCTADADGDGICDDEDECIGEFDECGECNGPGAVFECGCDKIEDGECDCDGNVEDALGVCGGDCAEDLDGDGICDDEDECVGELDECGECNGPGAIFECGCDKIEEGACDCEGNVLDVLGDCGGGCTADVDHDGICDDEDNCIGALDACGICNGPGAVYECGCSDIQEGECDCFGSEEDAIGVCGGGCDFDMDFDGICDDEDPCIGTLDACGICNGPGAIYPCGCTVLPVGDCDCDGNQTDAVGECGGDCTEDLDADGICDDVDNCVGTLDPCGVCNGPGAVYECGCDDLPEGDCDCNGNQVDALGVCAGTCDADLDGDGVCDDIDDCIGAFDACGICNGPGQIYECGCAGIPEGDCDCGGNQLDALGVCGGPCLADEDGDGICDDADDCVGVFDACGVCNGPGAVLECGCYNPIPGFCDCDWNQYDALGVCGGTCLADVDGDGVCDDIDDCVGAFDACGICNGPGDIYECGCTDIPAGDCDCNGNQLDALGVCGGACTADVDGDGVCDDVDSCVGDFDACGICNGPGDIYECGCTAIPAGDCDCNGNQLDALGVCGGTCPADEDGDGVCDDVDSCIGEFDACGICNGPGDIYECGCSDIPGGDCDCNGNQLDALGVCGGTCTADEDGDGVCDDVDNCIGDFDACGICNGPGDIYECGCTAVPDGDCDCYGNQLDALGVCGGTCIADEDGDGVCDVVDDCVGAFDACGICNGPGDIYECGCTDVPDGDCDCNGNQLDALGVCGGTCTADEDEDGVCDDVDDCVGILDTCGICNGPGDIYECGCADIPDGDCDCNGNQLDAIGVCGGSCTADQDGDGVCDNVDDCVGTLDACGVCNGPGAIYECGCAPVAPWACDCEGNVYDVCGECGGSGTLGCLDENACNYNGDACGNDGSCVYAMPGLDCDGNVLEVEGCTDGMAPNFDPAANVDDGSCLVGGCILPSACNFDSEADYYVAGACEFDSCVGCTDEAACNFDPEATLGSLAMCTYPLAFYLGCDGACLNDMDGDGTCDELEIPGCTNPEAPNFNPYATDDNGTCVPPLVGGCILPFACNYDEGANFYVPGSCDFECLYGASGSSLCTWPEACNFGEDGPCEFLSCLMLGCTLASACNFNPEATLHDGSCEFISCGGCMAPLACDFEASATIHTGCLDYASCIGCMDPNASNHNPSATVSGWCWHEGCTVPEACNYDADANVSDGTCEFDSCVGCAEEGACNFNPAATVAGFCDFPPAHFDCDGNCLLDDCSGWVVWGCTDGCACNYDPAATTDDDSCEHASCAGCMYHSAANYDATATRDDGSCGFSMCTGLSCADPFAAADFNGDGEVQVQDLMQLLTAYTLAGPQWGDLAWVQGACASPTRSLGEMLAEVVALQPALNPHCGTQHCAYPQALNFHPDGTGHDGGVCVFAGCTDDTAVNYDPMANVDDGGCRHAACPDLNGDGLVQANDLLDFLWYWHAAQ